MQHFSRAWSEADINWQANPADSVENDTLAEVGLVDRYLEALSGRPLRPPAKFTRHARHSHDNLGAVHLGGPNVAVTQVRRLLGC
jgi:hypothetical protein